MLVHNYNVLSNISSGSFGCVFKGQHKRSNELVAIKMEQKDNYMQSIKHESQIYQYLGRMDGFPYLKWYGSDNEKRYLVTNLLGKSITNVVEHYKVLSLKNVLIIGLQIFERIEVMHNHLLSHRDIKPDNFLFGIEEPKKVHLIDFGLCKRYTCDTGSHIESKPLTNIIGSMNYVSLNVHKHIEPSRRDDLESAVYILLYMYFGKLEWVNCDLVDTIRLKEEIIVLDETPLVMKQLLKYIRLLRFDSVPDYELLLRLIKNEITKIK